MTPSIAGDARLRATMRLPVLYLCLAPAFFFAHASIINAQTSHTEASAETAPDVPPLLARALALELPTPYEPPPGEALHHHTAGYAKILCSAIFLTGLDPEDAAANVGGFTAPFEERRHVVETMIDSEAQRVSLTLADGVTRTARRYASQGCVAHPIGEETIHFEPSEVRSELPPAESTPWPMGDRLEEEPLPSGVDADAVERALETGFGPPEAQTLAFVITHNGRILAERYADGIAVDTPLESWSMTKSLSATLMGVLIQQGVYDLWQPAPIPEWQAPDDPRRAIRIGDLMRMSSGLRIRAPQDPDYDPALGYPDHVYLYTATANSFEWAATRPLQWPPNTVGRYRNTDPVLVNYLIRLAVEARGEDYHSFPQRHLFDRIGIRNAYIETDVYGNFLGQGHGYMSARDWARLGNLYLQDGVWNGERILPEGYVSYAMEIAPAWLADGRPIYGGAHVWVNGDRSWPGPETMFSFLGAGAQYAFIVPTHGLVIVRMGKYRGAPHAVPAFRQALEMLLDAVPEKPQ